MVEARNLRHDSERAPERLAEERVTPAHVAGAQVGTTGWFPGQQQPRDAHHAAWLPECSGVRREDGAGIFTMPADIRRGYAPPRKEGGTAGANASRPFGPVTVAHPSASPGRQRLRFARDRRDTPVEYVSYSDDTPTTDAIVANPGAEPASAAPSLRAVAPAAPSYTDMLAPATDRIISLGGIAMPTLSTFTVSARLRNRNLLSVIDLTPDEIHEVLDTGARLKDLLTGGQPHAYLASKTLALLFEHPSTRTRISLTAGMAQLGGQAIVLNPADLQMSRGETIGDTARIFSGYVNGIAARVASHDTLIELSESATVPVYNALSDKYHPMQALSDMFTLKERFGSLAGLKLAYVGDGANNMAASLMLAGSALGVNVTVATPGAYQPDPDVVTRARWQAGSSGASVTVTDDPWAAAKDADAIYTDVHVSLNHKDGAARAVALAPFKVTGELMATAKPTAVFMHCLPMHRGEEVDAAVADGPRAIIFEQAANRLHVQKAVLLQTMC